MRIVQASRNAPKPVASARVSLPWGRWGLRVTALLYLGFMVALPLATIIRGGFADGLPAFWADVTNPTAFAALKLTLMTSVIITLINAVMGTLTAYVLVRFPFPGKGLLNALIDMPFAIPTLVTGVMLIAKGEGTRLERILICTAAGEPGKSDVRVGGRLARRLGATVTLLYVARESEEVSSLTRSHLDRAAATLKAIDVESEVRIRKAATPLAGIMAEATEGDYDLIVIGAHGPRSRIRFRPNDVMLQVLATAQRHVLVVPPDKV